MGSVSTAEKVRFFKNIFDYLCLGQGEIIAVQTTSLSNFSARRKKMLRAKGFKWWMDTKNPAYLQVWSKKSGRWVDKTVELTLEDWEQFQKEEAEALEKASMQDTPLSRSLFPDGIPDKIGKKNDS